LDRTERVVLRQTTKTPGFIEPQLATLKSKAPSGEQWLNEIKYDGYRIQLHIINGKKSAFRDQRHGPSTRLGTRRRRVEGVIDPNCKTSRGLGWVGEERAR
jgi:hypothetical protein